MGEELLQGEEKIRRGGRKEEARKVDDLSKWEFFFENINSI